MWYIRGRFLAAGLLVAISATAVAGNQRIDAGDTYVCAVDTQDFLSCWGDNRFGSLGTNSGEPSVPVPNKVAGPLATRKIQSFSVGEESACAIDSTGNAWCWGGNGNGQLAQPSGFISFSATPLQVDKTPLGANKFASISLGSSHTCALDTAGKAWCWGYGEFGQIGNGLDNTFQVPTAVTMPSGRTFVGIVAGADFTCALDQLHAVWCWGLNGVGQLGSAGGNALVPRKVGLSAGTSIMELWANEESACALDATNLLLCWGSNDPVVELAAAGAPYQPAAVSLAPIPASRTPVHLEWSDSHACVLDSVGDAWCWGYDKFGQLGDSPARFNQDLPSLVVRSADSPRFEAIGTGEYFTCAIDAEGSTYCWGSNSSGPMGNGTYDRVATAVDVDVQDAKEITSGEYHSCVLTHSGAIACWGSNQYGQLGSGGDVADYAEPQWVAADPLDGANFTSVSAGAFSSCALDTLQRAWCWGADQNGQLGSTGPTTAFIPRRVDDSQFPLGGLKALDAGQFHACAVDSNDEAWCWGDNDFGQLGDGTSDTRLVPVKVIAPGVKFLQIAAGRSHTCAIDSATRSLYCWGKGSANGFLDEQDRHAPEILPYLGNQAFSRVEAGDSHTCASQDIPGNSTSSDLYCFGYNGSGQLGIGQPQGETLQPKYVVKILGSGTGSSLPQFSLGSSHTCMRAEYAFAACWGYNNGGQLVDGSFQSRDTPGVSELGQVSGISAGDDFSCAISLSGNVVCGGSQAYGQSGDIVADPSVPAMNSFKSKPAKIFADSYESSP